MSRFPLVLSLSLWNPLVSWFNQKWKIALFELDTGNRDVRSS